MSDIKAMLYSPEEDYEECASFWLQLFKFKYILNLPSWVFPGVKVTRKYQDSEYQELVQRAYGFWYSWDDYFLQVKYGLQDESGDLSDRRLYKSWSCFIPWLDWTHVRHTIHRSDWSFFADLKNIDWSVREQLVESCPKIRFQVRDYDGEIIEATAYLEEREWHHGTGRFKWVRHFTKPVNYPPLIYSPSGS